MPAFFCFCFLRSARAGLACSAADIPHAFNTRSPYCNFGYRTVLPSSSNERRRFGQQGSKINEKRHLRSIGVYGLGDWRFRGSGEALMTQLGQQKTHSS